VTTPDGARLALAVDGGNSKTDLAILDESGALLSVVRGRGASPHELGVDGCVVVLQSLLERALAGAGLENLDSPRTAIAHVLLAGVDLPEECAELRGRIDRLAWSEQLVIDTDMPALLRAGTDRGWGIAVVCGAGINCLARAPDGREARFLSLGQISGDWGGGLDIGLAALAAAARSADGRGPRTALESAVPAHYGMSDPFEVTRAIHLRQLPMARLDELAAVVVSGCDGDSVATGIVHRLADEVIAFTKAGLSRLELTGVGPEVVLGGRILRTLSPSVIDAIERGVQRHAPDARVVVAPSEPIVGAALLGLDVLGADATAHERGRAELDAAVGTLVTPG
jgi:N-acetylglucosamine kinase-like BadF-type ATPase